MPKQTHSQLALKLARERGLLRPIDVENKGIPRVTLSRLAASGQLEKVSRGLYRLPEKQLSEHEGLICIATKVPNAVFCLLTALQFHELTTQLPRQVWIAMPRGSHTPNLDYPPIKMVQFSGEAYTAGIEVHRQDNIPIKVYSLSKTIVDCFKYRNKIGLDVALEALKDAKSNNKVSATELWHFAKICRVTNVMRPYLEAIE